jgi:hypothetical protein
MGLKDDPRFALASRTMDGRRFGAVNRAGELSWFNLSPLFLYGPGTSRTVLATVRRHRGQLPDLHEGFGKRIISMPWRELTVIDQREEFAKLVRRLLRFDPVKAWVKMKWLRHILEILRRKS